MQEAGVKNYHVRRAGNIWCLQDNFYFTPSLQFLLLTHFYLQTINNLDTKDSKHFDHIFVTKASWIPQWRHYYQTKASDHYLQAITSRLNVALKHSTVRGDDNVGVAWCPTEENVIVLGSFGGGAKWYPNKIKLG